MKPLTIEQVKALKVGDWVWFKSLISDASFYVRVELNCPESITVRSIYTIHERTYAMYGKGWLAYKNKEQHEAKCEIVELPCIAGDSVYLIDKDKIISVLIQRMEQNIIQKGDIPHYAYYVYWFDGQKGHHRNLSIDTIGIKWFTDKPQAEARLKELREKL